jgi:hypothetical protein
MFTQQDSEVQKIENQKFYDLQNKFIQDNNLLSRRNEYLNSDFFQYLVVQYQKHIKEKEPISKEIYWAFGKSLDILTRKNITHKSFLNYNDETKQDFYSNAIYRCLNYSILSFKEDKSAFNYFTTTIRNAFKEELNQQNAQKKIAKEQYETNGLDSIMYNVDTQSTESLKQEYIHQYSTPMEVASVPFFKQKVLEKYNNIKPISILEDDTVNRFQRTYHKFDLFIPVSFEEIDIKGKKVKIEKGLIIEYIDLKEVNENNGQYKTELQKRILVARQNGHQCFFLYSDVWHDPDIADELIFQKIDTLLSNIKEELNYNIGYNLMLAYIPLELLNKLGYTEPNWWLLDEKLDNRHIVQDQGVQEYLHYKNISSSYTRVWDAGLLKKL